MIFVKGFGESAWIALVLAVVCWMIVHTEMLRLTRC